MYYFIYSQRLVTSYLYQLCACPRCNLKAYFVSDDEGQVITLSFYNFGDPKYNVSSIKCFTHAKAAFDTPDE